MEAFYRSALQDLRDWADSDRRKPLVIRGARQVGKSTLVRMFGEEFDHYIELNLDAGQDQIDLFSNYPDVDDFVNALLLREKISAVVGKFLIFIDEIQESPTAIWMLRYFYEKRKDIHVIAAGSLLEFTFGKPKSYPVGRVQYYYLYPLSFEEFLHWGKHENLIEEYRKMPTPKFANSILFEVFNQYIVVGGMPAAVYEFNQSGHYGRLPAVYDTIWSAYRNDIEKYSKNFAERDLLRFILERAPYEHDRIKFSKFGDSTYKSREVKGGLNSLSLAGIIATVYPTKSVELPITPDFGKSPRLQFLDTGLMISVLQLTADLIRFDDLQETRNGYFVQHHLAQEMKNLDNVQQLTPRFWIREKASSNAEVDLVYQHGKYVLPIEVKSGAQGRLRSLHQFVDRAPHPYAIRFLKNEFSVERHNTIAGTPYFLMNLPYFLMGRIADYAEYLVSNYSLEEEE